MSIGIEAELVENLFEARTELALDPGGHLIHGQCSSLERRERPSASR
jgi:hypothetical protein